MFITWPSFQNLTLSRAKSNGKYHYVTLLALRNTFSRWFPELSTSYSRLNYGNHVPLPHFKDNRPIKNSHLITIKPSQPGSNFAERYYQTLDRAIKPLLSQVPVRQRNGIKFIDKENDSKIVITL